MAVLLMERLGEQLELFWLCQPGLRINIQHLAKRCAGAGQGRELTDQIAADRHLCSKDAAKSKTRGLRFNKLVPPGST